MIEVTVSRRSGRLKHSESSNLASCRGTVPHVQVNSSEKGVSARLDQARFVTEASFRGHRLHVAEKPVCHHDVLIAQNTDKCRIARIPAEPDDSLFEPWPDLHKVVFHLKHGLRFLIGQALRDMSTAEMVSLKSGRAERIVHKME
jgi:hypothetical protein